MRWALLDADHVVVDVVAWDGNLETWQPPDGVVEWVDVSDPDFFIEARGTLDPKTLEFVRAEPLPIDPDFVMPATVEGNRDVMNKLLDILVEKGTITAADVEKVDPAGMAALEAIAAPDEPLP